MQTGILDLGPNYNSQDKDNSPSHTEISLD